MLVPALEGHRIWSATYDASPNALLALDRRTISERLGSLRGLRVIDIGCGTGRWLVHAQEQGADVFGVDACEEMLRAALRKPAIAPRLILAEACRLPVRDASADLTLCSFALSYFPDLIPAFHEMNRITRPGGRVVVSDLHPDAVHAGWRRTFRSDGTVYELTHHNDSICRLKSAVAQWGLYLDWEISAGFGEPEREIFHRAGKQDLFKAVSQIPAIKALSWIRQ